MRIAVVGAGLSGLVVAAECAKTADSVVVLEASGRAGGQLYSVHEQGFVVEHGAEGFVAGSEAVPALATSLGVADQLLDQSVNCSYGFDGSALTRLEPGAAARFLGFQVKGDELGRGVRTFRAGMEALAHALLRNLGPNVRLLLNASVRELSATTLELEHARDSGRQRFDAIVLASSAAHVSQLLSADFAAARALGDSQTLSSLSVSLGFSRASLSYPEDASGFVVALDAQRDGLRACTFASNKFAGRARREQALLRLFFRPDGEELEQLSDADWIERAVRGLDRVVPLTASPSAAWVSRWSRALPVSDAAHAARVSELEQALAGSRIWLAGSAFHGSGIDAAVRSAKCTAERVVAALT
ncbi:MAG: FAD-dependent oxidoreductase [Polyangiaceae bacterium]